MRHVIIGNGIAGIEAAETIRNLDADCAITLIGGEPVLPYSRPMISLLLEGSVTSDFMVIRKPDFYHSLDIELVMGEWVQELQLENQTVHTDKGKSYSYDRLLIASGAEPRPLGIKGADLKNIFFMRNEAHIREIAQSLARARNALVIGCGLVGVKAAQALNQRGLQVTVVEILGYPLPLVVDEKAGKRVFDQLQKLGINVKTGSRVLSFEGNGKVKEALLSDGSKVSCDIVVVAPGFKPAVSFLPEGRFKVNSGILVDRFLATGVPGVYAAGDVAETMDIARNERRVNAVWPVAAEQGVIAGKNMAGRKTPYKGSLGRNVLRIGDMALLSGGLVNPPADDSYELYEEEDSRRNSYRKLVFREDVLVGVVMVNALEQGGVLLSLIQQQRPLTIHKKALLSSSFNYSQLLPKMWASL